MSLGNEYTLVEKPAIDYFKSLGYSYINGKELTPESCERESFKEVILHNRMFDSLKKLNQEISKDNINKIIRILQRPDNLVSGLLEINEKIYDYIVNLQLTVAEVIDNKKEKVHIIVGLIENLCHSIIYHDDDCFNYDEMKKEVILIIKYIINS